MQDSSDTPTPANVKKTFTILHTNDMHSNLIGSGPSSDYTPDILNDDPIRGGYARLAALISRRKEARKDQGAVLVLDVGDYSMQTAFGAASRETGKEGQAFAPRVEALETPRRHTPNLLPPNGKIDKTSLATLKELGATLEIKEWQAIMDHLRRLPVVGPAKLTIFPIDDRAREVRAFKAG